MPANVVFFLIKRMFFIFFWGGKMLKDNYLC